MERGERQHALVALEARLERAHPRRERVRRGRTEGRRADEGEPDRADEAERGDDDADRGDAETRLDQRVTTATQVQHEQPEHGTDAEQRDEHAELGVGGIQHLAHEHDAEREERPESERDRGGRGHHRAHERDAERVEEPHVVGRRIVAVFAGQHREARDERERHEEGRGVDPEDEGERAPEEIGERQRGDRSERGGAERDRAVRRPQHEPVRDGQVLFVDEVGDRRVARRQEDEARDLEDERARVHPPDRPDERHGGDDHRRAARPSPAWFADGPSA